MDTATLSPSGQVVIPAHLREELHLQPGDRVLLAVEGGKLIIERDEPAQAKLIKGEFGRLVLVAPAGAPPMTAEYLKAVLDEEE